MNLSQVMREIAIMAVPVLLAITCHEAAHGWAAWMLGDPTAKMAGRLTLNPLKHLDVLGTLTFVLTRMFGWAKPVPVNPSYFKNPRRDMMIVSVAGPAANFLLAALFALALRWIVYYLNATPDPFLPQVLIPLAYMSKSGVFVNLGLGLFNLLPVPPLDGSKILAGILPPRLAYRYMELERWGFIILIVLVVSGLAQKVVVPLILGFASFLI